MGRVASRPGRGAKKLAAGIAGGLIGGVFFGLLLGTLGMLPMIAELVGSRSVAVGLLVHGVISATFGALFALLLETRLADLRAAAAYGIGYGVFWWVAGALVLMPILLGGSPQLHAALSTQNLMSLAGHLIYGTALAVTVFVLAQDPWY
jgi:uncharacterized membrane protein YagU involved in acid resistance